MSVKIVNTKGIDEATVAAIKNDTYSPHDGEMKSDYTITQLLTPPRITQLEANGNATQEAYELMASLDGTIFHEILERGLRALGGPHILEKRFFREYEVDGNRYQVSAKIDRYNPIDKVLSDYKRITVSALRRGIKDEYFWQVNFQARLLRAHGYIVDRGNLVAYLKDWTAVQAFYNPKYPQLPEATLPLKLLSDAEVDTFIIERIRKHESAKKELPTCTAKERWAETTYALVRKGQKRAVLSNLDRNEAEGLLREEKYKDCEIEERPGKSLRCVIYCSVRSICEQAKQYEDDGLKKV